MADFEYTYCAPDQEEIRRIRSKYLPKEENKLERLRQLDERVTRKATAVSLIAGVCGILVFGLGMSCCLVWQMYLPGCLLGVLGAAAMAAAYPLYHTTVQKERQRVAPEILRLTDELLR